MILKKIVNKYFPRLIEILFITSPFLLFVIYLYKNNKVSNLEIFVFLITILIPLIILIKHFKKRIELLDRKATLHIHDNKVAKDRQLILMNIMEKMTDPLLILDSRNRILMANEAAHILLGQDILRQDIALYIKDPKLINTINRAHKTEKSESCEFKLGRSLAKDYLTKVHLFDLTEEQFNTSQQNSTTSKQYIFLALYDISAMKHTDRMRADFVANASHELRTPLASIIGFIETLQGPARDGEIARDRFLQIMYDESTRMGRLIEDLLSLSRIERDEHIPPSGKVNLGNLIQSVIDSLLPQAKEVNMTINFTKSAHYEVTGDHDQLTQVFQNLIENAIKYGKDNSDININCTINTASEIFEPKKVITTILNQGQGIAAEHLPRLMERFYRVDSARSRSLGGTGLGLAIVKHIIQRHRGKIFFESKVNSYTKVTLSLPI